LVSFAFALSIAYAEIEKFAIPGEKGMSFHWWPKLPPIKGWHQDRDHSFNYSINALAPDGSTFANAETVIYAKAVYKPRQPESKSLEMFIQNDNRGFLAKGSDITIQEVAPLTTAGGRTLRSYTFFPKAQGNWERVSYGEEGEFYLVFTVSSRSPAAYKEAVKAYVELIGSYKEKP
jgi:hypothetical protein